MILQTIRAQLATNARLHVVTERCRRQHCIITIDPYWTGLHVMGELHGLINVIGNDARGQAEFHIIGTIYHLIQSAELEDRLNGPENL